jgi:hypothetical protein
VLGDRREKCELIECHRLRPCRGIPAQPPLL